VCQIVKDSEAWSDAVRRRDCESWNTLYTVETQPRWERKTQFLPDPLRTLRANSWPGLPSWSTWENGLPVGDWGALYRAETRRSLGILVMRVLISGFRLGVVHFM
jgi:hypothetical protein